MSDTSQGPGWWQASDGRWYRPEQHPDDVPPPPPPPPSPAFPLPPPWATPDGGHGDAGSGFPAPWTGAPPPYDGGAGLGPYGAPVVAPSTGPSVTSGLALSGLILSVLWIFGLGSVLAVIFGIVALSEIKRSQGRKQGRGLARAALIIGAVGTAGSVALYTVGAQTTSPPKASAAPSVLPVSATVLRNLTHVAPSVVRTIGVPSASIVSPPTVTTAQPRLMIDGKPGAVFIGGVFCPYCAVERWAIIMAFSRFGSFSHLHETTSSPWDVYPSTATFTFQGASYASRYVTLDMVEHSGNDVNGPDTAGILEPLTDQEAALWQRYDHSYGYPFLDIGNDALVLSPNFSPGLLHGLDQSEIADRLSRPGAPSTQGIVGTATYLTAAICAVTGQKPASACRTSAVVEADQALRLSSGDTLTADRGPRVTAGRGAPRRRLSP